MSASTVRLVAARTVTDRPTGDLLTFCKHSRDWCASHQGKVGEGVGVLAKTLPSFLNPPPPLLSINTGGAGGGGGDTLYNPRLYGNQKSHVQQCNKASVRRLFRRCCPLQEEEEESRELLCGSLVSPRCVVMPHTDSLISFCPAVFLLVCGGGEVGLEGHRAMQGSCRITCLLIVGIKKITYPLLPEPILPYTFW